MSRFDEIVGNPKFFKIILDNFFNNWPGSYVVLINDPSSSRLFEIDDKILPFCRKVRSHPDGYARCVNCDHKYAQKAAAAEMPINYICHAGLIDIAVPIMVWDAEGNRELIATILCGQRRSSDMQMESEGIRRSRALEEELGFAQGELLDLRESITALRTQDFDSIKEELWEVAQYVSDMGSQKLETEKAKQLLTYRLKETEEIQNVLLELSEVVDDMGMFWSKLSDVMMRICDIIGSVGSAFVVCEKSNINGTKGIIQAITNLPESLLKKQYPTCNLHHFAASHSMKPVLLTIPQDIESNALMIDILGYIDRRVDALAVVPIKLNKEQEGAMLFFISHDEDIKRSLDINHELELLTQLQTHISTSYANCLLYNQKKENAEIQSEWLEDVSHQILAPINGIVGQAENLQRSFQIWQMDDPQRIENTLVTLMELSNWAARMASNFAWVAKDKTNVGELNLRVEGDLSGKLIGYARNVQALAKKRRILRVHVELDTVKLLNNRIKIDNKFFKQAVTNLLDNAVKYSDPRTDVILSGALTSTSGYIHVTNIGIPISEGDVEQIFERGYRTVAAKAKYAVGSGIGLTIAREIVSLHGGSLTTEPSVRTEIGWKTTFTIALPLV